MTRATCIPYASDDRDLPFPPAESADLAALDAPIYVGGVEVHQRGVQGLIHLEVMLEADQIHMGPFMLSWREVRRLWRLLGVTVAVLNEAPTPVPESGRGIAGWNLDLARNASGLAAAGTPWEGETLP